MGLICVGASDGNPECDIPEAFLSYIGHLVSPPDCSWGVLAKEGIQMLRVLSISGIYYPAFMRFYHNAGSRSSRRQAEMHLIRS